jgi:uncharacterized membrane protein YbaN (DUF454 family)
MPKSVTKIVLAACGTLCVGLGVLGAFLPLLPTTPFLLLAAFLYAKSSDRLYDWLLNHRILGQYIRDFREEKAIPLRVKIVSVSLLWITIGYSALCVVKPLWVKLLLFAIAVGVSVHILSFKTKKSKNNRKTEKQNNRKIEKRNFKEV